MLGKKLNRRDLGKLLAGSAGALAAPGVMEGFDALSEETEGATTQQARREIDRFRVSFDNDNALISEASESAVERWYLPAVVERDRHQFLYDYFSNTRARYMPAGVQNRITPLMPGLAAQESRFHTNRESPAGAVTILQFLPSTYKGLGGELSIDELKDDFAEQVEFAFKHLDESVYKLLADKVDFDGLCSKYGVNGSEKDEFIALSVINAYKAGQGNMVRVLNSFHKGFLTRSLPPGFDKTGLGLFYVMSNFMSGYGRSIEPDYGPQSHEYPLKVIAGAESLGETFDEPYGLKVDRSSLLAKGVGAAVGLVVADGILDPAKPRKTIKALPKDIGLAAIKSPVTVAQLVSRTAAMVVEPKKILKKLPKKKAVKPKLKSETKASKRAPSKPSKTKKSPLLTRRRLLATAATGGVAGLGAALKGPIVELFSGAPTILSGDLNDKLVASEVPKTLADLNRRGIFLSSSWEAGGTEENGEVDACGRTTLAGLREVVLDTVVKLLEDLDLLDQINDDEVDYDSNSGRREAENHPQAIVLTGGAEGCDHSKREHGHGNGYAVDLRKNSSDRIEQALVAQTTVVNDFTRVLSPEHKLMQSGLVIGDKIFRFNGKYFLFGVQNRGQQFVCYFDAESSHRHLEMIPWDDYNVESQAEFKREAKLPNSMRGIWRESVRDHVRANL